MQINPQTGEVVESGDFPPGANQPVNPAEIESIVRSSVNEINKGVRVVSNALEAYRRAEAEYDRAFAGAYMAHKGAAHERKYAAELATTTQRNQRDAAEVAWRYADRRMRAFESQLSGWQTISKSVTQMFSAGGAS